MLCTDAELTPKLFGPTGLAFKSRQLPKKSVLVHTFGKISSLVTFNVTSRTTKRVLRSTTANLPYCCSIAGRVRFLSALPRFLIGRRQCCCRRAARLAVTGGRITMEPAAPGSGAVLEVVVEARRTPSSACAPVRVDRSAEPGECGCRFVWLRKLAARRGIPR